MVDGKVLRERKIKAPRKSACAHVSGRSSAAVEWLLRDDDANCCATAVSESAIAMKAPAAIICQARTRLVFILSAYLRMLLIAFRTSFTFLTVLAASATSWAVSMAEATLAAVIPASTAALAVDPITARSGVSGLV